MQLRRGDAQERILQVATVLALHASWETFLTRPTWAVLCDRTGISRRSLARYLRWLRDAGLLGLVATGTTPAFSPGVLLSSQLGQPDGQAEQNEAAVYVLMAPHALRLIAVTHPEDIGAEYVDDGQDDVDPDPPLMAVDETGTPTDPLWGSRTQTHARENRNLQDPELTGADPGWPAHERPTSKAQRRAAALEARRRDPVLARISTPYAAALLREWHLAGWTVLDALHALNHRPDGTRWPHNLIAAQIAHVPGWVRYRLSAWQQNPHDQSSPPGRSHSQRAASDRALAAARRQAQAAEHTAAQAAAAAPGTQAAWAQAARAALRHARASRAPKPSPDNVNSDTFNVVDDNEIR